MDLPWRFLYLKNTVITTPAKTNKPPIIWYMKSVSPRIKIPPAIEAKGLRLLNTAICEAGT